MTFNKNLEHLVPPLLLARANELLSESVSVIDADSKERCAQQFEVVRDFCIDVLERYTKKKRTADVVRKKKSA